MEWVEVTGKTLDEARQSALEQLGVSEHDAEVIVLSEPKAGLFGRMKGEARVRARVRPVGPRPKRNQRPRSGKGANSRNGRSERDGRSSEGRSQHSAGRTATTTEGGGGGRNRNRSRSGGGRANVHSEPRTNGAGTPRSTSNDSSPVKENDMAEGMTLQEQADVGKTFLVGLLDAFGYEGTVSTVIIDEQTAEIAVHGEDLGLLVGPRGSTLAAIQDVTRTVVQRHCPSRTDRILVDVADYRRRRAEALTRFAKEVAAAVHESGEERALEPMSPADRKTVHDAVNEIEGIVTRSEGEDPRRYIVISAGS